MHAGEELTQQEETRRAFLGRALAIAMGGLTGGTIAAQLGQGKEDHGKPADKSDTPADNTQPAAQSADAAAAPNAQHSSGVLRTLAGTAIGTAFAGYAVTRPQKTHQQAVEAEEKPAGKAPGI